MWSEAWHFVAEAALILGQGILHREIRRRSDAEKRLKEANAELIQKELTSLGDNFRMTLESLTRDVRRISEKIDRDERDRKEADETAFETRLKTLSEIHTLAMAAATKAEVSSLAKDVHSLAVELAEIAGTLKQKSRRE